MTTRVAALGRVFLERPALASPFRRAFATTLSLDFLARAISAAATVVLIRALSVPAYAYLTLFLAVSGFLGSSAGGGVRMRYLRERAESRSRGESGGENTFPDAFLASSVVVVGFGAVGAVGGMAFGAGGGTAALIGIATAFAIGFGAVELGIFHLQAEREFGRAGVLGIMRSVALLVIAVVAAATPLRHSGVGVAALSVLAVVWVGSASVRSLGRSVLRARPRVRPWVGAEAGWLTVYYIAAAGFAYVDVVVAKALLTDHDVAALGATLRYLSIVMGAVPALIAVMRVRTAQSDVVLDRVRQNALLRSWLKQTAAPVGVALAAVGVGATFVIPLVDAGRYPSSIPALQIFLATAFAAYVGVVAPNLLMAQRRYGLLAIAFTIALAVNAVGDVLVAPRFGIEGIAAVSSGAYVAVDLALLAAAFRGPSTGRA